MVLKIFPDRQNKAFSSLCCGMGVSPVRSLLCGMGVSPVQCILPAGGTPHKPHPQIV